MAQYPSHENFRGGSVRQPGRTAFSHFEEDRVDDLVNHLGKGDLIVGFNIKGFDYKVLGAYTEQDLSRLPTFDMLADIHGRLGFRLGLDHLATETLGKGKTAHGLQAVEWFRQGEMEKLTEYCRHDVAATRDLFQYGLQNGHVIYRKKGVDARLRLLVDWDLDRLVKETAHDRRRPFVKAGSREDVGMKAFDCKMCGECCYGEGGIFMEEDEQKRIAEYMGLEFEDFLAQYTVKRHGRTYAAVGPDNFCIFFLQRKRLHHSSRKARPMRPLALFPGQCSKTGKRGTRPNWRAAELIVNALLKISLKHHPRAETSEK